ncbi:BMP family ABC transporter substrate-binding protein [Mycoplasmatota bacterium WC30]
MKTKNLYKLIFVFFLFALSSCDFFSPNNTTQATETTQLTTQTTTTTNVSSNNVTTESELTIQLKYIYNLALEADTFTGTYEEWLETVTGPEGEPGKQVTFQVDEGYIQWQYVGDTEWTNLVELATLVGPTGPAGADGIGGLDGKSAYEIYLENYPDYEGDEQQWLNDLINGDLATSKTFTVTFDTYGGSPVESQEVKFGHKIIKPIEPIKEGFTFKGWSIDNDKWAFSGFVVTEDITLNAMWELNHYTITYAIVTDEYNSDTSIVLTEGETISQVYSSSFFSSAITSKGRVFTWGNNDYGQLGDGTTIGKMMPVDITSQFYLSESEIVTQVSLGGYHAGALTSEGRAFTWGWNDEGQLGDGTRIDSSTPVEITSKFSLHEDEKITKLVLGHKHSLVLTSERRILIWGYNGYGQLGDGTRIDKITPIDITSQFSLNEGEYLIQASLGGYHSAALTSEGRIFTWGMNRYYGQLGDGSKETKEAPIEITDKFTFNEGETITHVLLGYRYSLAQTSEGRIYTWGNNEYGQLGDGTTRDRYTPVEITSNIILNEGETITSITIKTMNSSAITNEGRIFVWGDNRNGQLGDGTTIDSNLPIEVTSGFDLYLDEIITNISLGTYHSLVRTNQGNIFSWGGNEHGQLGDGTTSESLMPKEISTYELEYIYTDCIPYGSEIEEFIPSQTDYIYGDWHLDINMITPFVFGIMPAEDITLYAKQEKLIYEIAMITDGIGELNDSSFNEAAWDGVVQYAEANDISYAYYRPSEGSDSARIEQIEVAIINGAKIVVCPGYIFETAIYEVQEDYPEVAFLLLDGLPHSSNYSIYLTADNTHNVIYQEEQAGFLAGYAVVIEGYRDLGFIGGMAIPPVDRYGYGFVQGAEYAAVELGLTAGDVTIRYDYADAFVSSPELETKMDLWYAEGIEIIFTAAGGGGQSVMTAAENTVNGKVIGVDVDQAGESDRVITSAMKGLTPSVLDALTQFYDNNMEWPITMAGETALIGADCDGVGLPTSEISWRFDTFTLTEYNTIFNKLVDGIVVVSQNIDVQPTVILINVEYDT